MLPTALSQEFIENPGERDVAVSSIFTDDMFEELEAAMKKAGFKGVQGAANIFKQDYRSRKVCAVFCGCRWIAVDHGRTSIAHSRVRVTLPYYIDLFCAEHK